MCDLKLNNLAMSVEKSRLDDAVSCQPTGHAIILRRLARFSLAAKTNRIVNNALRLLPLCMKYNCNICAFMVNLCWGTFKIVDMFSYGNGVKNAATVLYHCGLARAPYLA